jgi:hypothetical protein
VTTASADAREVQNRPAGARRPWAATTASISAVALMTASCHAGSVAKAPASTPKAATQAIGGPTAAAERRCGAERSFQPTQSELPGFTQDAESLDKPWPGHADGGFPDPIAQNYVCGEFGDFIANIALSGYAPGSFRRATFPDG